MFSHQNSNESQWHSCQIEDLQAGDILLFRPSRKKQLSQKFIMACQALLDKKHGHYDTVHVAVCTGKNANDQPMIAHVTVIPNHPNSYLHEPLQTMLDREEGDRSFNIYRPLNAELAERIAHHSTQASILNKFNWSITSAAASIMGRPRLFSQQPAVRALSVDTFCSRFVVQVMKQACADLNSNMQHYNNLKGHSSPKALESFLSQRHDYMQLCYLGKTPYLELEIAISEQLVRLSTQTSAAAQQKYHRACDVFQHCQQVIEMRMNLNDADKVKYLLNAMLPIFKETTDRHWVTATSYKALTQFARNRGIFKPDPLLTKISTECTIAPQKLGNL